MTALDYFESVVKQYELEDREAFVLASYFGARGERLPYAEVGQLMAERGFGNNVSKQRVHSMLKRMMEGAKDLPPVLPKEVTARLKELFPLPASESKAEKESVRARAALVRYLREVGADGELQYVKVHELLGFSVPEHRANAGTLDDLQSCAAFYEDYGAKNFGRYRRCTMCGGIKPSLGEDSQFYLMKNQGKPYVYQVCRSCNSKRCVENQRNQAA